MALPRQAIKQAILRAASRRKPPPGVRVLDYHFLPSSRRFSDHVAAIRAVATIIDERRFVEYLSGRALPTDRLEVLLTFDDGYRNIVERGGCEVPQGLGVRPIVFALACIVEPTAPAPSGLMRDATGMPLPLCSAEDLRALATGGWSVGSHTFTHWDCGDESNRLEFEICGSRTALVSALQRDVSLFAYPWGKRQNASSRARELVMEGGYAGAFSTVRGPLTMVPAPPTFLRRDVVDDWWTGREVAGCLAGGLDVVSKWGPFHGA